MESGLDDFSHFCPAEQLHVGVEMNETPILRQKNSKVKNKVAWFSRRSKASSTIGSDRDDYPSPQKDKPSRKGKLGRKNRNSLPVDVVYPSPCDAVTSLQPVVTKSETSTSGEDEEDYRSNELNPTSCVTALQNELHSLKGCVSERRTVFSPSTSPDLDSRDPLQTYPPSLPKDEPFEILSSDHIVLPMQEYSIQVSPFIYPDTTETNKPHDQSPDVSCDPNIHSNHNESSSHDKSHDHKLKITRQGSLEYDHLEPEYEVPVDGVLDSRTTMDNGGYFVSIQFSEQKNSDKHVIAENTLEPNIPVSVSENHFFDQPDSSLLTDISPFPRSLQQPIKNNFSSSIPGRLNSPNLSTFSEVQKPQWNSASHIPLSNKDEEVCHCPSCCSCGSSQRQLSIQDPGHRLNVSSSQHSRYYSEDLSNASWPRSPVCPLKRFTDNSTSKLTFPRVTRLKNTASPAVSKQFERVSSDGERKRDEEEKVFGSSVEVSHSNTVIEDELDISGCYGNQFVCDPETQSLMSHTSCQSSITYNSSHSYYSDHNYTSFNKGVDGTVFKQRMELITQWFSDFNDQQRNSMLLTLLEQSNCVQMHMLSVQMEPILHQNCPHNCQDLLSWLPPSICLRILSFLDPVSLCRSSQVSRSWYLLANDSTLWKGLCSSRYWQLSLGGHGKQLQTYTSHDGTVEWKNMFAERFRLRRNWLKGYCTVRTFEGHSQGISCLQFDDTRIVSGSWDKTIKVWNRRTNTAWAALTLAGHSGTVRCLHLHGNRLVSGSSDRTIKVWDLATNNVGWVGAACKATMIGHLHTVRCLQADDKKVVSGSYDYTLKVWDIKTGNCTLTLRGHTDAVLCLQFDNEKVISGSKDTTIKVWQLTDGQCKHTLHGHEGAVTCLQFDDSRIISGALDRLIKIWNLSTGQCLRTIDWIKSEGHTGVVRHLQADSWKIVSAADDKTLKVWSVHSGERLLTLKSHTDGVTCLQFNDQVIVSGSYDKSVKLWDFSVC